MSKVPQFSGSMGGNSLKGMQGSLGLAGSFNPNPSTTVNYSAERQGMVFQSSTPTTFKAEVQHKTANNVSTFLSGQTTRGGEHTVVGGVRFHF